MKPGKFMTATYWLMLTAIPAVCGQMIGDDAQAPGAAAGAADSLEYWLRHGDAESAPAMPTQPAEVNPFAQPAYHPSYALPGAVQMSDGKVLTGWLYTTEDKPIRLFVEDQKRWRLVPLAAALSISAVVVEARLEKTWRWKQMGKPERVYTGKSYPTRRLAWRIKLADGSEIVGAIKGQPVFLAHPGRPPMALVLHERQRGRNGQELTDLVFLKKLVISRRPVGSCAPACPQTRPASRPAR